uniref:Uncharacterized protein LOC104225016 n=1 Tax=Nicotiana sylvestris TaxID=4096 RepID=A0A1U7WCV3_NICSY
MSINHVKASGSKEERNFVPIWLPGKRTRQPRFEGLRIVASCLSICICLSSFCSTRYFSISLISFRLSSLGSLFLLTSE